MNLAELCVRRPVFTCMLVGLPVMLGGLSYFKLGVDLFPNVDLPIVTVTTTRKGAGVEEMETGVTKPLEEIINTVAGIDEVTSITREGISLITVTFHLEKNRDVAAQEVRDKVSTIMARLPAGTDPPVIDKWDLDAQPVMSIAVSGRRDLRELTEIADKRIREQLQTVDGVGAVVLTGGQRRAVNIVIDTDKLQAYRLSVEQVRRALERQNLEIPGGRVDQSSRELTLRTMGRVLDTRDFNDIIIVNLGGQPIRIRDVGRADDTYEEIRGLARLDGDDAVNLIVQKQSGYNTVRVIELVKARLAELGPSLPSDVAMHVIRDQSRFIVGSLEEVRRHLILGAILVAGTILLFIRDWRTTVIASLSIPTSLVSTFLIMHMMGFTLNTITMLALVLAVGVVIDDAVVVHENIFRHMEELGRDARTASIEATKEIAQAVVATTLSLLVIFLPLAFMQGRIGRFFSTFGYTMAFAVAVSLLVGFTLTPMLCSRFLKLSPADRGRAGAGGAAHTKSGLLWRLVAAPYLWSLRVSLRHRWAVVLAAVGVLASTVPLFNMLGQDFIPRDDQSEFEISVIAPEGWTLKRTDRLCREIEGRVAAWKDGKIRNIQTVVGDVSGRVSRGEGDVTRASIYVRIAEIEDRRTPLPWVAGLGGFGDFLARHVPLLFADPGVGQFDLMARAREMMTDYPDVRSSVNLPSLVGGGSFNADINFHLLGPDLRRLDEYSAAMILAMRRVEGLVDVDTTLALRKPELRVDINRDRAGDLNVDVETIAATLSILVGGQIVGDFKDESVGEQYDVWLRAEGVNRNDARAVWELTVPSKDGRLVQLANVTGLSENRGPSQIDRFNRRRKVTVYANAQGISTTAALSAINEVKEKLNIPPEYAVVFTGRAKHLFEAWVNFAMAFALSAVFMYMILAAQFESFLAPVTILLAAPLTIPFALLSLLLLGQSLDVYATLGLFLLFGIVKKNGILQVDYTNHLRAGGMERDAAIMEANAVRLRPILMTTVMLVAGMIPMALGSGPGSSRRASVAKVIVGGQALSLLLTLLITPVSYSLFDDLTRWFRRRFGRGEDSEPTDTASGRGRPVDSLGAEPAVAPADSSIPAPAMSSARDTAGGSSAIARSGPADAQTRRHPDAETDRLLGERPA